MGSRRFWHLPVVSVVAVGLLLGTTEPAQAGPRPANAVSKPVSINSPVKITGQLDPGTNNRTLPTSGGIVTGTFYVEGLTPGIDYQLNIEAFEVQNSGKPKSIEARTTTPFHTGLGQTAKVVKTGFKVKEGYAGKELVAHVTVSRGGADLAELKPTGDERMTVRVASGANQEQVARSRRSVQQPEESMTVQPRSTQSNEQQNSTPSKKNSFFDIFDIFGLSS